MEGHGLDHAWGHTFPTPLPIQTPIVAPTRAGTYHILFAFSTQYDASNVASGTYWVLHHDVWDDGNDIAELSPLQIAPAQEYGCTIDRWLVDDGPAGGGYAPQVVPADAITLQVR